MRFATSTASLRIIDAPVWRDAAEMHRARMLSLVGGSLNVDLQNPIYNFIFVYYSFDHKLLLRYSPGAGVLLKGVGVKEQDLWTGRGYASHGGSGHMHTLRAPSEGAHHAMVAPRETQNLCVCPTSSENECIELWRWLVWWLVFIGRYGLWRLYVCIYRHCTKGEQDAAEPDANAPGTVRATTHQRREQAASDTTS